MPVRPSVVAFDVIGTLFPLGPLRGPLGALGLPPPSLEAWMATTLRDGFALAASGAFRPFAVVAAGTLDALLARAGLPRDPAAIADVLSHFSRLDPRPEAARAIARLREGGVRAMAVSNGAAEATRALLARAGLADAVGPVVSIDEVGAWKPRAEVYLHAAGRAGVEPGRMALVAAHAWDCGGAARAGLTTGWVSTPERVFNPALGHPDVRGDTLFEVAEALLALDDD